MTHASQPRILLVKGMFYPDLMEIMSRQSCEVLQKAGTCVDQLEVPGAFEIPGAIAMAAQGKPAYDGYVALGCVMRGETSHYDYVCMESARGLMELAVRQRLALGYGILTVESHEQAFLRAKGKNGETGKGTAAAQACLAMMAIKNRFHGPGMDCDV